ncbi:MAG: MogA/MoaB family molybdenum cofactor biosynthesis protein [Nitrososphaerota archaeon]|nr:MogA/MoaB family molybdenum cofactor biosynthesis protein [Nitrososphaerota archaeon]MDG6939570.1 MogA/MoaB family molybdenum cofactor biosynthesis protein [Nitrososphaerota archaeon]
MKPHEQHRARGKARLRLGVITVSTSRYRGRADGGRARDESGDLICGAARRSGNTVAYRAIVPDDVTDIRLKLLAAFKEGVDAVILTGGTGVSPTDVTVESVVPLLDKELPGFGELFRAESRAEVGTAAMMSRALLGVARGSVVACLPGSPDGAALGMKLLLPELPHISSIARGGQERSPGAGVLPEVQGGAAAADAPP